ncbi:HEAT repeat domain-containing protein [Planctomycetota bacterium]
MPEKTKGHNDHTWQEIEAALTSLPKAGPKKEVDYAVLQMIGIKSEKTSPVASGNSTSTMKINFFSIILAACACLLIGLAIFQFARRTGAPVGGGGNTPEITRNLAADSFYILKTDQVRQESVIQDFDAFLVRRLRVGSLVSGFTIVEVEKDALKLKGKDGLEERFLVRNLNTEALKKLEEETGNLVTAFRSGQFQQADLQRLEKISSFGQTAALNLLEDISASDSKWNSLSETILKANEELSTTRKVIKLAKAGSFKSRVISIGALGKIQSPLAAQCLREIIFDSNQRLALLALDSLVQQNDEFVCKALETITSDVSSAKVRERAQLYLDKIFQGVERDK